MPSPTGTASRCDHARCDAQTPLHAIRSAATAAAMTNADKDRLRPIAFDAAMERVPDEIDQDRPHHRVDENARAERAALPAQQRDQTHRAEDKDGGVAIPICATEKFAEIAQRPFVNDQPVDTGRAPKPSDARAFQISVGENTASAMTPESHGHGVTSHLRSSGTSRSQAKMPTAKKIVVYFDSMPTPNARPIASHHAPRPVFVKLDERQQQKCRRDHDRIVGRRDGRADGHDQRQIEIERRGGADPLVVEQDRAGAPDAQLAGNASSTPNTRTPNSVLPNSVVPAGSEWD